MNNINNDPEQIIAKRCLICNKMVYFLRKNINSELTCINCNTKMIPKVIIDEKIKLQLTDAERLSRRELNELNASQEDTGPVPRFY